MPATMDTLARIHRENLAVWTNTVRQNVRSREDAEDIVAEAFLLAAERVDECTQTDLNGVAAWVYGFIKNLIRSYWRPNRRESRERSAVRFTEADPAEIAAIPAPTIPTEIAVAFNLAIQRLGTFDRQVVTLMACGYSQLEIGAMYGVCQQRINQRAARAFGVCRKVAA